MSRTLNLKALSAALGRDKGQLSRWAKRAGFPKDNVNCRDLFSADEVRAWIDENVKTRVAPELGVPGEVPSSSAPAAAAIEPYLLAAAPVQHALANLDDPFVKLLLSGSASPLDISKASVQLVARQVANQALAGVLSAGQLDALKKSLEELRRSDDAYMELALKKGELVERTTFQAVAGKMAQRLTECHARLINGLGVQMELWLIEPEFVKISSEERQKKVRGWIESQSIQIRSLEAQEIDRLLESELKDQNESQDGGA